MCNTITIVNARHSKTKAEVCAKVPIQKLHYGGEEKKEATTEPQGASPVVAALQMSSLTTEPQGASPVVWLKTVTSDAGEVHGSGNVGRKPTTFRSYWPKRDR